MEIIDNVLLGLQTAFSLEHLLYCLIGVLFGTAIGVLPGLGPVTTIAMLLPLTYALTPVAALIMLAGIYYGAQYGGSTTAILVNLPGEIGSVVTCIDGHQMARNGHAGKALATAALSSFFAGTVATLLIAGFAPILARVALEFGSPEYFSLMVLGLIGSVVLAHGSFSKAVAMIVLGLLLGLVGIDLQSGVGRFTFEMPQLSDGIGIVGMTMGVFAISEIIINLERQETRSLLPSKIRKLWPSGLDFRRAAPAAMRGTAIGSFLGLLPGGGTVLSSFASYAVEKKLAKDPSQFGHGAIEGVAGPEAANNAGAQTSFIPLLTLGLPSSVTMALMVGAMSIHNIQPGPQVITNNPTLFWGLIASMWIGNLMLLVLNLPLIALWVKLLTVPYKALYPAILLICAVGAFSVQNNVTEVYTTAVFGIAGYLFYKLRCEPAPLLLGFVLGPMMEENFRRSMVISRGELSIFVTRPVSLLLLVATLLLMIAIVTPSLKKRRKKVFEE